MKLWEIQAHEKQFLTPSESRQAHELVTTKNFSYMRDAQPRRENIPTPPSLSPVSSWLYSSCFFFSQLLSLMSKHLPKGHLEDNTSLSHKIHATGLEKIVLCEIQQWLNEPKNISSSLKHKSFVNNKSLLSRSLEAKQCFQSLTLSREWKKTKQHGNTLKGFSLKNMLEWKTFLFTA